MLRITRKTFPIHMETMRPQKSEGFVVMTCGPGAMSCSIRAPIMSAITAFDGMPSVSIGMKLVCAPALLADSGPATPRMLPSPKGGLAFLPASFFSSV